MFSTELKFASDCLINWFNLKFKKQNLELGNEKRRAYEIENPIDWKNDNCKICNFALHINLTTFDVEKEKMSYGDFIIKKEQIFEKYFLQGGTHVERCDKNSSIISRKFF